jgi:hypothetical protein
LVGGYLKELGLAGERVEYVLLTRRALSFVELLLGWGVGIKDHMCRRYLVVITTK